MLCVIVRLLISMNQHIFSKYHSGDGVEGLLEEGANDGDLGYGRSWGSNEEPSNLDILWH